MGEAIIGDPEGGGKKDFDMRFTDSPAEFLAKLGCGLPKGLGTSFNEGAGVIANKGEAIQGNDREIVLIIFRIEIRVGPFNADYFGSMVSQTLISYPTAALTSIWSVYLLLLA